MSARADLWALQAGVTQKGNHQMSEGQSFFDKAKDKASDVKDKASDLVGRHEDKLDSAIDKTGDAVDKVTGGKFGEHVDKAQDAAKGAVDDMGNDDDEAELPGMDQPQ